jgi:hypothetical protein
LELTMSCAATVAWRRTFLPGARAVRSFVSRPSAVPHMTAIPGAWVRPSRLLDGVGDFDGMVGGNPGARLLALMRATTPRLS